MCVSKDEAGSKDMLPSARQILESSVCSVCVDGDGEKRGQAKKHSAKLFEGTDYKRRRAKNKRRKDPH